MKRRLTQLAAAFVVLLAGLGVVAAQSRLPGNGWTTGFQFQNVGDAATDVRLLAYGPEGIIYDCGTKTAAPGGSVNFLFGTACQSAPADFSGSALVESTEPLRGIAHVNNAGTGQAGGIYTGTTQEEVATTIFFPLVKHNHFGRTTTFQVQNATATKIDLTATFRVQGATYTRQYDDIPIGARVTIVPADAGMPAGNGQVGSLSIAATGAVAGTALEHEHAASVARNLQASRAFTPADYDSAVYCPLFRNAHTASRLTTGAQVQNVGSGSQTVTFAYTPRDGGQAITSSRTVAPGASATFYAPFLGIPEGSVGSATITSTGDVVAVVNDEGQNGNLRRTTTYACFPAGRATERVVLPLYKEYWYGNTSGIQIQNVAQDGRAATVTITYIATNRNAQVRLAPGFTIPAGGSTTFFGVSEKIFPPSMVVLSGDPAALRESYGSVIIEADAPIVAIANESSFGPEASNQDSKGYEGFNE